MKKRIGLFAGLFLLASPLVANPTQCPSDASARDFLESPDPTPFPAAGRSLADSLRFYETDHFVVIYQVQGRSAVAGATVDTDGDGTPDNVQSIGSIAERVWRLGVDTLGYPAPRGRDSTTGWKLRLGRDNKFPIMVGDMSSFSSGWHGNMYLGYMVKPRYDPDSAGGMQMVVENDFMDGSSPIQIKVDPRNTPGGTDSVLYDYSKDPVKGWKATIAHEFYHALQFQFDATNLWAWHEATATWFAKRAFPQVKHHWQYLHYYLEHGRSGAFSTKYDFDPYANFFFVDVVAKVLGEGFVHDTWLARNSPIGDEDIWFSSILPDPPNGERAVNTDLATEAVRLASPAFEYDGGWRNFVPRASMIDWQTKDQVIAENAQIAQSVGFFGPTFAYPSSNQFESGKNLYFLANLSVSTGVIGVLRQPSNRIETFVVNRDTTIIGPEETDSAWLFCMVMGYYPTGAHSILEILVTSKPALAISPRTRGAVRAWMPQFNLLGQRRTPASRSLEIQFTPRFQSTISSHSPKENQP